MTSTPQPRRRAAWNLAWTLPLAVVVQLVGAFWASLTWCGISGCSGGGYGRISDPSEAWAVVVGLVTWVVWTLAIALVPWHPSAARRWTIGAIVGLVLSVLGLLWATSAFVR